MNVALTEEQGMLQDSVAKFRDAELPIEKIRELAEDPNGLTDELWQKMAEQGWLGVMIPEEYGGLGLGVQELGVICEELGRGAVPGPYLSTVLVAHALTLGGTDTVKQAWLQKIATGEAKGALALIEENAEFRRGAIQCAATKSGDGYALKGKKFLVADALAADFYIVAARTGEEPNNWLSFFLVERVADGVSVKPNKLTDLTSRSGQVQLDNVAVGADAVVGSIGGGSDLHRDLMMLAAVCVAADSVAGAEHTHRKTIAYTKERTQFGQHIGSFQAVKHPLVDFFCEIESARSAYHYAAWAVDAKSADAKAAAAVARKTATEAYRSTALGCLQASGGIAFTWEYDLHIYLKRAKHNQFLYGLPRDFDEAICRTALAI